MALFDISQGIISILGPEILKGAILELFNSKLLNTKIVTKYVQDDVSLWSKIGPKYQWQVKRVHGIDWLTTEWLLKNLSQEMSVICSLFLGDEQAMAWLERQLEEIKQQVQQPTA